MVEVGDDLGLPTGPGVGPDGGQVGGREHEEHLQQLGRADLDGEADRDRLVAGVAAQGEVVHHQVLVDEEFQGLGVFRVQTEPLGRLGGDPQPDLAVVFRVALAEVVDQQGQVEDRPPPHPAIDPAQRPLVGQEPRRPLHRPQAMLIDGELVVLVELEQSPGVGQGGNKPLQEPDLVQAAQQLAQPLRVFQER